MPDPLAQIDASAAVAELEALAAKLGVSVDYDHFTGDGAGSGGLCRVRGQWRLIVERQSSPGEKASVLARALSRFELEPHFISPSVRELIERVARASSSASTSAADAAETQTPTSETLAAERAAAPAAAVVAEAEPEQAAAVVAAGLSADELEAAEELAAELPTRQSFAANVLSQLPAAPPAVDAPTRETFAAAPAAPAADDEPKPEPTE